MKFLLLFVFILVGCSQGSSGGKSKKKPWDTRVGFDDQIVVTEGDLSSGEPVLTLPPDVDISQAKIELTGDDKDLFEVDENGQLRFKNSPDFENSQDSNKDGVYEVVYNIEYEGRTFSRKVEVEVENAPNDPPTISNQVSSPENQLLVSLNISDLESDPVTLSLLDSTDYSLFEVLRNQLYFKNNPNYEDDKNVYSVRLSLSDGNSESFQDVQITLQNVNEAPNLTSNSISIDENTSSIPLGLSDPEDDTINIQISGIDSSLFQVNNNLLSLVSPANHEDKDSYSLSLTYSDSEFSNTVQLTVSVNDVNEAPVLQSASLSLEAGFRNISMLNATDPESDTINYSILDNDNGSLFSIDENGNLSFKEDAQEGSYNFTVQVSDGEESSSLSYNVAVNPLTINNKLFFSKKASPYLMDENYNVKLIKEISKGMGVQEFNEYETAIVNGVIYFKGYHLNQNGLFSFDGTKYSLVVGSNDDFDYNDIEDFGEYKGSLYVLVNNYTNSGLYIIDVSDNSYSKLIDIDSLGFVNRFNLRIDGVMTFGSKNIVCFLGYQFKEIDGRNQNVFGIYCYRDSDSSLVYFEDLEYNGSYLSFLKDGVISGNFTIVKTPNEEYVFLTNDRELGLGAKNSNEYKVASFSLGDNGSGEFLGLRYVSVDSFDRNSGFVSNGNYYFGGRSGGRDSVFMYDVTLNNLSVLANTDSLSVGFSFDFYPTGSSFLVFGRDAIKEYSLDFSQELNDYSSLFSSYENSLLSLEKLNDSNFLIGLKDSSDDPYSLRFTKLGVLNTSETPSLNIVYSGDFSEKTFYYSYYKRSFNLSENDGVAYFFRDSFEKGLEIDSYNINTSAYVEGDYNLERETGSGSSAKISQVERLGEKIYFKVEGVSRNHSAYFIFETDGTEQGTRLAFNQYGIGSGGLRVFEINGDKKLFVGGLIENCSNDERSSVRSFLLVGESSFDCYDTEYFVEDGIFVSGNEMLLETRESSFNSSRGVYSYDLLTGVRTSVIATGLRSDGSSFKRSFMERGNDIYFLANNKFYSYTKDNSQLNDLGDIFSSTNYYYRDNILARVGADIFDLSSGNVTTELDPSINNITSFVRNPEDNSYIYKNGFSSDFMRKSNDGTIVSLDYISRPSDYVEKSSAFAWGKLFIVGGAYNFEGLWQIYPTENLIYSDRDLSDYSVQSILYYTGNELLVD